MTHNVRPFIWLFALVSCSSPAASNTPRAVADQVITALDKGDASAFLAVLPAEAELTHAFDCGRNDTLRNALQRRREDAPAEFAARRQAGHRVRLVQFDKAGSSTVELVPGDVFQGCTVLTPVTVHRSLVELSLSKSGRMDLDQETWTFVRFTADGPWSYVRL